MSAEEARQRYLSIGRSVSLWFPSHPLVGCRPCDLMALHADAASIDYDLAVAVAVAARDDGGEGADE